MTLNDIKKIGFVQAGSWNIIQGNLDCKLKTKYKNKSNLLYAFANKKVFYIGKTIKTLEARLRGYYKPGPTQSTNIRINAKLKNVIKRVGKIDIYVLVDEGNLKYHDYSISLAAGLEDALIRTGTIWNYVGNKKEQKIRYYDLENIRENSKQVYENDVPLPQDMIIIKHKITKYYLKEGVFNFPKKYKNYLPTKKCLVKIYLKKPDQHVIANFSITNKGQLRLTPRVKLRDYFQRKLDLGDELKIAIVSRTIFKIIN